MNETNNDQNQKPKTSRLARASFGCLLIFLVIFSGIILSLLFGHEYSTSWYEIAIAIVFYLSLFAAPVLGIMALIKIKFSKEALIGKGFAIPSIAIPSFLVILVIVIMPQLGKVKPLSAQLVCGTNVKELGTAIFIYSYDNDGYLPMAEIWCDLIIDKEDVRGKTFFCPSSDAKKGQSSYALNKNIAGIKLDEVPDDVVLLFETTPGWNQVGGPEILTVDNHKGKGCNIGFADGHSEFVKTEDLDTLRWEP